MKYYMQRWLIDASEMFLLPAEASQKLHRTICVILKYLTMNLGVLYY